MPTYYPAYLDLNGRPCAVVGGGEVAARKAESLLESGARVTVISPELHPELTAMHDAGRVRWLARPYAGGDLDGMVLVVAATDRQEINRAAAREAQERGLLINVVDDPSASNFIVPAVVRRGDLQIAVSTGGASPMLARRLREELEGIFGPEYEELLAVMGGVRARALRDLADPAARRELFRRLVYSDVPDLLRAGRRDEAARRVEEIYDEARRADQHPRQINEHAAMEEPDD